MAVNRISAKVNAYRVVAKPGPTPENEVIGIPATGAIRGLLTQPQPPSETRPAPYVNIRGETTGTVINTSV